MFNPVPKPEKYKKLSKVQIWNRIRKQLKKDFEEMGITECELRLVKDGRVVNGIKV